MCGVIGYIGEKQAQPVLFNSLSRLEYRGYDSCGVGIMNGTIRIYKDAVRVEALAKTAPKLAGTTGIGHTRWATYGKPSLINAHPHVDCTGKIAVVHNGVIHNIDKLKKELTREGHKFVSETDTEVIPHLIEKYYRDNLEDAVRQALNDIEGSYAIIVMMTGEPSLVAARKESPLILGIGDRENFIASDIPAVLDYTNRIIYLEDGDIAVVGKRGVRITNQGEPAVREEKRTLWNAADAQRGGYEHFMLKEIHEQPRVINDTIKEYLSWGTTLRSLINETNSGFLFLGCGTSYHAGLVGKYLTQELLKMPVMAELASEFIYSGEVAPGTLSFALTQSGETADTLKAMRKLKAGGNHVVAITNVVGSSASRIADETIYTRAGPEISVAATKSFIAQLVILYWLMISLAKMNLREREGLISELRQLPGKVQRILDNKEAIIECADYLHRKEHMFFVGRGINYPIALEGALKMKEISYIFAEGYAAGEFKHGSFALLSAETRHFPETPVIAIVSEDKTREAMLTNIKEIGAREAPVVAIVAEGDEGVSEIARRIIKIPRVNPLFSPVLNAVVVQLLAYYVAKKRNCVIDFPRNLAKSVTVE